MMHAAAAAFVIAGLWLLVTARRAAARTRAETARGEGTAAADANPGLDVMAEVAPQIVYIVLVVAGLTIVFEYVALGLSTVVPAHTVAAFLFLLIAYALSIHLRLVARREAVAARPKAAPDRS